MAGTKLPTQMELADIAGNEDAMSQLWIDNRADLGEDWGFKHDAEIVRLLSKLKNSSFESSAADGEW